MTFFSLVSVPISLAAASSYVNCRYIRLSTTVGVLLVVLVASLTPILVVPDAGGLREQAATSVSEIDFNQVVLHGMLAFLLFAGSIHVDCDELGRKWLSVSLLAIVGTLVSTCIVGGMTWLMLGWLDLGIPFLHALLFGALIPPTDPIVVGFLLLKEIGGALLLGLAAGIVTYRMLKRVDSYRVEVLLTIALAMGICSLADALHLSAPIAVVVAGLFVGNQGRAFAMTEKTREHVGTFWELVDEILNVVLFLLIGLEFLVLPIERGWLLAGILAIPIVLSARWLSVAGIIGPLGWATAQAQGAIPVLTWGGLRGGISAATALSTPPNNSRSLVLTLTYFVVVFSLLVQRLTVGRVIRMEGGPPEASRSSAWR